MCFLIVAALPFLLKWVVDSLLTAVCVSIEPPVRWRAYRFAPSGPMSCSLHRQPHSTSGLNLYEYCCEDLGQPECDEKLYHGPRWVELAAESGELGRGGAGVVVVVQALPEGYEREQLEVG